MPYRLEGIDGWLTAREAQWRPDDELLEVVEILTAYAAGGMSSPNGFWIGYCVERLTGCSSEPIQKGESRQDEVVTRATAGVR